MLLFGEDLKRVVFFIKMCADWMRIAMIKQFVEDVAWGKLDYLVIDTPPGTSDEHISIVEYLKAYKPDGAVIVTTPQGVSLSDVRKEISFCRKVELKMIGLVENMSGYKCPHCDVSFLLNLLNSRNAHKCFRPVVANLLLKQKIYHF